MSAAGSAFATTFRARPWTRGAVHACLVLSCLVFVFPMLWMLSTSLKPLAEVMVSPPRWFPEHVAWRNYVETVRYIPFWTYAGNTLLVSVLSAAGTTFSSALVAFSFTRLEWPGKNLLFGLTLATMMVPYPVLMVPLYGLFRSLEWTGTSLPLWVPSFFGGAFNIFLLRQFFTRIPAAIGEAMMLDGASELQIFWRVYVPLGKSALSVVAFFQFVYSWNDLLGPLLYLTEQSTFTLALGLQAYEGELGGAEWHYLMAASVLTTLPIVVLFFLLQRTFLRGLSSMSSVDA
jgi:multiple sugar transport system permease protein